MLSQSFEFEISRIYIKLIFESKTDFPFDPQLSSSIMDYICSTCEASFPSRSERDIHTKNHCPLKVYTIQLPGHDQPIPIVKNTANKYACQCQYGSCNKEFKIVEGLQKHVTEGDGHWGAEASIYLFLN